MLVPTILLACPASFATCLFAPSCYPAIVPSPVHLSHTDTPRSRLLGNSLVGLRFQSVLRSSDGCILRRGRLDIGRLNYSERLFRSVSDSFLRFRRHLSVGFSLNLILFVFGDQFHQVLAIEFPWNQNHLGWGKRSTYLIS